jgi:hypothetical protein
MAPETIDAQGIHPTTFSVVHAAHLAAPTRKDYLDADAFSAPDASRSRASNIYWS